MFKGFDRALVEAIASSSDDPSGSVFTSGDMSLDGHIIVPKALNLSSRALQVSNKKIILNNVFSNGIRKPEIN